MEDCEFIRYMGPGLLCNEVNENGITNKLIRVAMFRDGEPGVLLQAEFGDSMEPAGELVRITDAQYDNRRRDVYQDTVQAIWALRICGFVPCGLDSDD